MVWASTPGTETIVHEQIILNAPDIQADRPDTDDDPGGRFFVTLIRAIGDALLPLGQLPRLAPEYAVPWIPGAVFDTHGTAGNRLFFSPVAVGQDANHVPESLLGAPLQTSECSASEISTITDQIFSACEDEADRVLCSPVITVEHHPAALTSGSMATESAATGVATPMVPALASADAQFAAPDLAEMAKIGAPRTFGYPAVFSTHSALRLPSQSSPLVP